jgi:hypothetical protein
VSQQGDAIDFRHVQVREDDRCRLAKKRFLGDATIFGFLAGKALFAHQPDQELPKMRFVVDDETARGELTHQRRYVHIGARRSVPQCHDIALAR